MSFLNQALADENIEAFQLSLKDIIRVHGKISELAKKADLSRGTLYKLMQGKGQAEIGTILKLIHALGYDLAVTRRHQTVP
jgi:probable addiction module antidote protein